MRRRLTGRVHKRPFVVTTVVLSVFVLTGVLIVLYLGFFRQTSQTGRVRVGIETAGTEIRGLGLNVQAVPLPNRVWGSSFENITKDQLFTVYEGSDDYVYLLQSGLSDQEYGDDSFVGGTVRIMSLDEQGRMVQKLRSEVVDFDQTQFSPLTIIEGTDEIGSEFSFIVSSGLNTVAFSRRGQYVTDLTTASRRVVDLSVQGEIIAATDAGGRFSALSSDWIVYTSVDGKNFNSSGTDGTDLLIEETPRAVTSVGDVVVACGDEGKIIAYSDGELIDVFSGSRADLLAASGDGKTALFVGSDGEMLTTSNGVLFRRLDKDERPFSDDSTDWVCATYSNDLYIAVGSSGETAFGNYDINTGRFRFSGYRTTASRGESISPRTIIVDSFGEVLLLDESGKTFILSNDRSSWKELSTQSSAPVQAIGRASDGKIVMCRDTAFYLTRLLTRIEHGEHLTNTTVRAGDMCFLSSKVPVFDGMSRESTDKTWQVFGSNCAAQISSDAPPSGGASSLKLYAESDQGKDEACFLSQVLDSSGAAAFSEKTFYRIEVWLKQTGMSDGEVMVWLSGEFESVGTVFTDVGNNWRHYSALIVLPAEACGENAGDVRLNIGFLGQGELYMDKVFFGEDKFSSETIPDEYQDMIREIKPSFLRLSNVIFGKADISSESYYYPVGNESAGRIDGGELFSQGCTSLEASLRMTRYAEANPWLIIDSSTGQDQAEHLMEYLCGSISDPYGKVRIDNGTAVPWSSQFDQIVFEMSDSDDLFLTDLQRGAFVDYMINVIKASPHYLDIKDRVLFLDGMNYVGGSMLSTADYHTTSMHINESNDRVSDETDNIATPDVIEAAYLDYYDGIPRIISRPQEKLGEWIGSAGMLIRPENDLQTGAGDSRGFLTAADHVNYLLYDLGHRTSMICVDLPKRASSFDLNRSVFLMPDRPDGSEREQMLTNIHTLLRSLASLNGSISGIPITVDILPPIPEKGESSSHNEGVEALDTGMSAYGFVDGNRVSVIVTNTSEEPRQFRIETDFAVEDMIVDHYSDEGEKIGSTKRRNQGSRFTLLPGQYIIASGETKEP
ncbi:MAG: hypothetical protein JW780_01825 [Clostridiales bacterium]|nr:hypothetical protein [Clostridiales bacterium]